MSVPIVEASRLGVMLIDAQRFFWDTMHGAKEPILMRVERLLMLVDWLGLPLIATFEHPVETKGWLPERLERVFPSHGKRFVKRTYDCCSDPAVREAINEMHLPQFEKRLTRCIFHRWLWQAQRPTYACSNRRWG
ncbi:MAG: hypothetical protein ABSG74_13295 [Candidatus Bathyarchaeia archaeon]